MVSKKSGSPIGVVSTILQARIISHGPHCNGLSAIAGIKSPRGAAPEAFENRCDIEFRVEKILV
jgi:hypothetical protein